MSVVAAVKALAGAAGFQISRIPATRQIEIAEATSKADFLTIAEDVLKFFDHVPYFYGSDVAPPLRIAGAWRDDLVARRANQLQAITSKDRVKLASMYEQMFFNELCAGLQIYSYYDGATHAHPDFEYACERFQFLAGYSASEIATPRKIRMWGDVSADKVLRYTDPNHAMQAITILNLVTSDAPAVLDIGSGFGGTAEKIARLYKRPIDIWLLDIPANLTTAYAYLAVMFGREAVSLIHDAETIAAVGPNTGQPRFLLAPASLVDVLPSNFDVVHNNGSFSEMDRATVDYYIASTLKQSVPYFVETNSNIPTTNTGNHAEVMSATFKVPNTHRLVARYMPFDTTRANNRYMTSIYARCATQ